ncbi:MULTISPECIES: hypothetical protein [unclassified Janthinobacterium]|uniref:hypothetical protein n=1 Tax=unclassified Janthinobacterium TaxID=2610881 RepID=UPI00088A9478|nr:MULTISPECIES: hypothetical protein [unclassified Janthinobacterium]SDA75498.1 hypothetical protein SAMN03159349_04114 [Janthinobacterium sp. 551a]SFB57343.1 hypothetical protein SAMN03159300_1083 [Janthinobacterium sp. 344]
MNEKHELIQGILDLERKTKKRVPGLLFEICFSTSLFFQLESRHKLGSPEFGWLYIKAASKDQTRHWFKVYKSRPVLSATAQKFIDSLPAEHRYFSIQIIDVRLPGQLEAGALSVDIMEFSPGGRIPEKTELARKYETEIVAAIRRGLGPRGSRAFALQEYADWFGDMSVDELELLFVTRCLMNFGLPSPGDVDIIAVTEAGNPVVVEFKRKNPALGRLTHLGGQTACPHDLVTDAFEIAECLLSARSSEEAQEIFSRERSARNLEWSRKSCFGLDLVHYRTLQLCDECGVGFNYFIWDWTRERGGQKQWAAIDDLANVLSPSLSRKRDTHVVLLDLKPDNVSGLTWTFGSDSGSYTDSVRVQLTFDFEGRHVTRMAKKAQSS